MQPQRLLQPGQQQQDTSDKDSGVGSPYCMLDWLDHPKTCHRTNDSSCFDMDSLKTELGASGNERVWLCVMNHSSNLIAISFSPPTVTPSSYRSSSCGHDTTTDPLKQFLLAGQFSSLLPCEDTYSRKVFVGGLPPDLGDGEYSIVYVVL